MYGFLIFIFISTCYSQQQSTSTNLPRPTSINNVICGLNGNTETICLPSIGDTWNNGTWYPITWNTMYPTYVASSTLDIYIYFVQNYQNVLIKKIPSVSTSQGTFPVLVDDTWRLDNTTTEYESLIYIVTSNLNPEKELSNRFSDFPPPVHFFVNQAPIIPLSTILSSTTTLTTSTTTLETTSPPSSTPTMITNKQTDNSRAVQPWVIAAVVLACLAVLGACLAIVWIMRHNRKRKLTVHGEKEEEQPESCSTIPIITETPAVELSSSTTLLQPYLLNDARPQSTASISSRSEPPLTSTDALLIADTFRQRMRRPDWQDEKNSDPFIKAI